MLAAVLVVGGLVLATTAPAGPSTNNKVDAYGGPVPQKPTNPKTRAVCDKYYSAANKLAEAQGCRATAAYNVAKKACAKKSGAKKAACLKAAKRRFSAAKAKVAKQAKAEKSCQDRVQLDRARDRGEDLGARHQRTGLRRAAIGARGAGDRCRDDAAGLPEEGTEQA